MKLQFPNSDVQDVLRYYEQLTGKRVIMDNFVNGKVNIFLTKDPTREEAIQIIQISLLMNGFSLVPEEPDIVKVIGTGKNPRTQGVPIISDQADIPAGDQVVSYLFRLRYADPAELQQVIGQYLSPPQPYTSVLPLPKSSSILITENSTVIRGLVKIIEQIDVAPAEVTSEFIKLERADASKVVDMLKDIFEKGTEQTQPGMPPGRGGVRGVRGVVNPVVPNPAGETDLGALTALSEDSVIVGKIKIAPDVRTNRIHVITRPINMPFIRKLIAQFDANVEFAKPVTRTLRYISASDVLPVLVQALTEPGQEQQAGAGGAAGPQAGPTPQRTPNPTVTNPYNAGQTSTATGSSLNISEELSTQPVDTAPKAVTIGNAKIIADQRANTIIVLGNREVVVKVQKILDEMDVKAPQVALSTVIGELTLNNDEEFGVDYFIRAGRRFALTTNFTGVTPFPGGQISSPAPSPGGSPILSGGSVFDPGNLITFTQLASNAAKGTNIFLAAGSTLAAVVHALDSTGKFKTISRPTVFTSNNKKAIIANGQEIPVPVSTLSNATSGTVVNNVAAVQSSIEYKKVALQLEVVPLINSEKEVSLDILQKIDSVVPNSNVNIGGNSVPTIATRYIRTNVSAPNCSTIVLGGLISEMRNTSKNGIPYLSRLPLVGSLFRGTVKNRDRAELLILMRPEVSLTKLDLYRLRQKTEDRDHFGPELEQEDCPDCPKKGDGKQLPPPDIPTAKDIGMR
ncbi:MAG TPA: secretin N-terminal domain-containing protein [Chthoniobacterales bacterium]|nr:secretin N-terminal domain-containing protein [Chthoniobacterales bacterium]